MADVPSPRRAVDLGRVRWARGEARVAVPRSKVAGTRAFRRMRMDRVLGLVGLAVVLFALVLVFKWEKPPVVEPSFAIDWTISNDTIVRNNVIVLESTHGVDLVIPIDQVNLTRVVLNLTWTDDVGNERSERDVLSFNLSAPASSPAFVNISKRWAEVGPPDFMIEAETSVNPVPNVRSLPVLTLQEAKTLLGDRTNRNGTGSWTLHIHLPEAIDDFQTEAGRNQFDGVCPQPVIGDPADPRTYVCQQDTQEVIKKVSVYYEWYSVAFRGPG